MVKKVTNEDIVMLLNEGVVKEQIQTRILLPQILVLPSSVGIGTDGTHIFPILLL